MGQVGVQWKTQKKWETQVRGRGAAERPRNSCQGWRSGDSGEQGKARGSKSNQGPQNRRKNQEVEEPNSSHREQGQSRGMKKQKTQLNGKSKKGQLGKSLQDKQLHHEVPGFRGKSKGMGNAEAPGSKKWKDECGGE